MASRTSTWMPPASTPIRAVQRRGPAGETFAPIRPSMDERGTRRDRSAEKSNWALPLRYAALRPAYAVTCGITFTFGGLRVDTSGRVLDEDLEPLPGLHAAGELVGGLFYFNYPGGAGLTAGAVLGRIAGATAAAHAAARGEAGNG